MNVFKRAAAAAGLSAAAVLLSALSASARPLHVDGAAKAAAGRSEDGTPQRPYRTIGAAAAVALPGDTVYVHAGVYRESVRPARSGTANAPIVYRTFGKDAVTISGADPVKGWTVAETGGVYKASFPADFFRSVINQADQVFVDGRMVHLARWPNTSPDVSRPAKSTITRFISKTRDTEKNWTTAVFEDENLSPQTDGYYVGAEVVIQPNKEAWSWTLSGTVIAQQGKTLTIRSRSDSGKDGKQTTYADGSRYYLHNRRTMLDAAGEWFHDRAAGVLYLRTPQNDDPARHTIEAKRRDWAFDLDGRSYITVQGFRLFACSITTDASAGDGRPFDETGKDRYPWRGKGTVAPADHIIVDGIEAKYLTHFTEMDGHFFLLWGQNTGIVLSGSDCIVRNCRIQYSAGNGISLLGRRNKAFNNLIEDVSYQQFDTAGISTGGAADSFDHEIAYNTIRRTGRSGITPRNLRNSSLTNLVARIHHNDISASLLQDFDGGCVYGVGDGTFVRIDHNWCHDVSGFTASGIYPDGLTNWIIDHNVVWNVEWGIHLQNNGPPEGNALCYNNTILVRNTSGTPYGPFGFGNNANHGKGDVIVNNIVTCLNPSESKGYKPISGAFEEARIDHNLFWDAVPGSPTDPHFVDIARLDFALRPASPARDKGVMIESMVYGGVAIPAFNDPVIGKVPDLGAYEYGAAVWRAGCNLPAAAAGTLRKARNGRHRWPTNPARVKR
jgi:hypothetical protein